MHEHAQSNQVDARELAREFLHFSRHHEGWMTEEALASWFTSQQQRQLRLIRRLAAELAAANDHLSAVRAQSDNPTGGPNAEGLQAR